MKPTEGKLDLEQVRILFNEGLGTLAIARRLRRRNGDVVAALRSLDLRRYPDALWLSEHYLQQQESIDEIAAFWHVGEAAIRHHLRNQGIAIRYKSRGSVRNRFLADADWLYARYVTEMRSQQEVADLAGCRPSSVVHALARHGIVRFVKPPGRYVSRQRHFKNSLRRAILERDGYQCRWPDCGATERLEVNHIVPMSDGGLTTFDNGITLCRPHHQRTFGRESEFIQLFSELIGASHLVSTPPPEGG